MLQESAARTNEIANWLTDSARSRLQLIDKAQGSVLIEAGETPLYVYFPIGCIVTLLHTLKDGSATEVSTVGQEGMIGVESFWSGQFAMGSAVVCSGGQAYRLRTDQFRRELSDNISLRFALLRFTQELMSQITQTAACHRYHTVSQQLCRWLLNSMARIGSPHISMTHELIARMLGVRREGVTESACKLQKLGVISYSRGHIEVRDRDRLESMSCECYGAMQRMTVPLPKLRAMRRHDVPISTLPQRLSA